MQTYHRRHASPATLVRQAEAQVVLTYRRAMAFILHALSAYIKLLASIAGALVGSVLGLVRGVRGASGLPLPPIPSPTATRAQLSLPATGLSSADAGLEATPTTTPRVTAAQHVTFASPPATPGTNTVAVSAFAPISEGPAVKLPPTIPEGPVTKFQTTREEAAEPSTDLSSGSWAPPTPIPAAPLVSKGAAPMVFVDAPATPIAPAPIGDNFAKSTPEKLGSFPVADSAASSPGSSRLGEDGPTEMGQLPAASINPAAEGSAKKRRGVIRGPLHKASKEVKKALGLGPHTQ